MDYFLAHREGCRLPERVSFAHACFSAAARGERVAEDARAARAGLQRAERPGPPGWVTRRWLRAR